MRHRRIRCGGHSVPQDAGDLLRGLWEAGKTTSVAEGELPRFPPVPADRALETFRIRRGYRLELAASEPDVVSPVALAFDEDGRAYVAEMIDYSERRDLTPHAGRIRRLEACEGGIVRPAQNEHRCRPFV